VLAAVVVSTVAVEVATAVVDMVGLTSSVIITVTAVAEDKLVFVEILDVVDVDITVMIFAMTLVVVVEVAMAEVVVVEGITVVVERIGVVVVTVPLGAGVIVVVSTVIEVV